MNLLEAIDPVRGALTVVATLALCAWSTVCFAWVDERSRRYRRDTMHALAAQRRRFDAELHDIRTLLNAHLGIDVTGGWPEVEPATVEIPLITDATAPMGDVLAAELVRPTPQPRVTTVEREFLGYRFQFREDA